MLSPRRALLVAVLLLSCFLILRHTHSSKSDTLRLSNSPKPNGSYSDNRKIQDFLPDNGPTSQADNVAAATATSKSSKSVSDNDNGGRIALAARPAQQIPLNEVKLRPLRQQLSYAFPYRTEIKFPAYIWQTWKYAPSSGEFEEAWRPFEASWTELHPNFVHEVITDDVASDLIQHLYASIPEVHAAYTALPKPVLKADFFRYLILLARGGIYSDIDTKALRSAVEWVPQEVPRSSYGLVIGIEADPDRPDWREWYSRRIQFCQWTIQSKPGHPVLVDIVASITENTLRMQKSGELSLPAIIEKGVIEFTGPAIWTDAIFRFFNDPQYFDMSTSTGNISWEHFTGITRPKRVGDVVVLPITSFSPGVRNMGAGETDDEMAFVQHTFEGTWKPESERHIGG